MLAPVVMVVLTWFGLHQLNKSRERLNAPKEVASGPVGGAATPQGNFPQLAKPSRPSQAVAAAPAERNDDYRVMGVVLNNSRPELSVAMLERGGQKGAFVERPFEQCRVVVGVGFECLLAGVWYGDTGEVRAAEAGVVLPPPVANSVPYTARVFGMPVEPGTTRERVVVDPPTYPARWLEMSADALRGEVQGGAAGRPGLVAKGK